MKFKTAPVYIGLFACLLAAGCSHKDADSKLSKGDWDIKNYILSAFASKGDVYSTVQVDVNKNRVLLSGEVAEPKLKVDADEIAWKAPGVKAVINETQAQNMAAYKSFSADVVIVAQARAKLLGDDKVNAANYTVESINGTVYLLGAPKDGKELKRVNYIISKIQGVKKIIDLTMAGAQ